MIYDEFDSERRAIINPEECCRPVEGFPELCIGVFSKPIMDWVLKRV